jgi:hypothetical protein
LFLVCLLFSISGENNNYVTPTNPAAHASVPGGSSSGAAVAVAANLVDFSLGELLISVQQLTFLPLVFICLDSYIVIADRINKRLLGVTLFV